MDVDDNGTWAPDLPCGASIPLIAVDFRLIAGVAGHALIATGVVSPLSGLELA